MTKTNDQPLIRPDLLIEAFHSAAKQLPLSVALSRHYYLHDLMRVLDGNGCKTLYDLTNLTAEDLHTTPDAVQSIKSELAAWHLELKPSSAEDKLALQKFDQRRQAYHRKASV